MGHLAAIFGNLGVILGLSKAIWGPKVVIFGDVRVIVGWSWYIFIAGGPFLFDVGHIILRDPSHGLFPRFCDFGHIPPPSKEDPVKMVCASAGGRSLLNITSTFRDINNVGIISNIDITN